MKNGLLKKIASGFLASLLVLQLAGVYFLTLPAKPAKATLLVEIPNLATDILTTSGTTVTAAADAEQSFLSKILDFAAVTAAQSATKLLSGKITNWLSNGAEGPLFTKDDFKTLLLDVADQTLRKALTDLDINKADNEFPFAEFNLDTVLIDGVDSASKSSWISRFVKESVSFTAIGSPIAGDKLGYSELTSFYDKAGVLKPEYQTGGANQNQWSQDKEMWAFTIPLKNCTYMKIAVNHDFRPIAYTNSGKVNSPDPKLKPTDTIRPVENSNTKKLEFRAFNSVSGPGGYGTEILTNYEPFETGSWDCGGGTPWALDLARTLVNKRNVSLEDIATTSFEKITGLNLNDFIEDASLAYQEKDPYYLWSLAGEPENTQIGTNLNYAAAVGREIIQQIKDKELDFTAPGFLPDVTCGEKRTITYPDGSEELICDKNKTLSPQAAVTGYAKEALTTSFKNLENTDKWQKILFTAAIQLTASALEGGLNYVANEIQNSKNDQTVAIEGLGAYDQLNPNTTEGTENQDDNAWQNIANKKVDFSKLNEQINLTLAEAEWLRLSVDEMRELPALYFTLDRYFALGPDIGWQGRIQGNFGNDISKLVQEISTSDGGDDRNSEARSNLLNHLQSEIASEISYTKEALETIPYPGQVIVHDTLKKVESDAIFREDTKSRATDKRNISTVLISIRDEMLSSVGGSQDMSLLLKKPPVWPEEFIVDKYKVELSESSINQLVRQASEENWDNSQVQNAIKLSNNEIATELKRRDSSLGYGNSSGGSRSTQTRSTAVSPGQTSIDTSGTQGDVDGDSVPDDIENLMCESFGTCTDINPTNGLLIEFDDNTDSDGDGIYDYQEFLSGDHPVYERYGEVDLNGDGDTLDLVDINKDGIIDLREGDRDCNNDGDFNDTCALTNVTDIDKDGFINEGEGLNECTATNRTPEVTTSCNLYRGVSIPEKINTYLGALEDYNQNFNNFVENLNNNGPEARSMRVVLNRLVNRYLGIENDISKESSLRQAKSGYDLAREKINNIRTLMDQTYLTWYELDKGSKLPETDNNKDGMVDAIGRTGISIPGFGYIENIPDMWCLNEDNLSAGKCLGREAGEYAGNLLRRKVDGEPARVLDMLGAPVTRNGLNQFCPALRRIADPSAPSGTGYRTACVSGAPTGPTAQDLSFVIIPNQTISSGDTLTVDFPNNMNLNGLSHNDVDITLDIEDSFGFPTPTPANLASNNTASTWGVTFSGRTMTIRVATGTIQGPLIHDIKVKIGKNASYQVVGTNQATNSSSSTTTANLRFNGSNPQGLSIPGVTGLGVTSTSYYEKPMAAIMHRLPSPAFNWYQWGVPGMQLFFDLYEKEELDVVTTKDPTTPFSVANPHHLQYPIEVPLKVCPIGHLDCYTWVNVEKDGSNNITKITPQYERVKGIVYNLQQPYFDDQLDRLYCNQHGLLFNDLNVFIENTTERSNDSWLANDGTLEGIGGKWWKSTQKCSDWYRSEYGDYLAK